MNQSKLIFFLGWVILLSGCVTYNKYPYLLSETGTYQHDSISINALRTNYLLQIGDVLDIKVTSTVATDIEVFNKRFEGAVVSSNTNPYSSYFNGYIIDKNGEIEMPLLGKIKSTGLTCEQLNDTIQSKLAEYVKYANVATKLGIFRITILGEVQSPGTKDIVNMYNLNIYQAIGLAGDATDLANKSRVKLIRKSDKEVKVINLNLSKASMIASEYYYLKPNDVIYVHPLKAKVLKSNASNVAIIISVLTFFIVVLSYSKR